MSESQKISTCLWYNTQAEEAANLYVSLFDNSRITNINRRPPDGPMAEGKVLTVNFELEGTEFTALNGGPNFAFTEASSMVVKCDSQEEVDRLWEALLADGGQESQCGWLKDRYGLSWQIIPRAMFRLFSDEARAPRVMAAMMDMVKLDIAKLEAAYNGE